MALSDNHTSQFKPHQSLGKYAGISCKSSSNKAPLQVDGNVVIAARSFLNPAETFGGNLRSNGDSKVSGNGIVNGDATPAPGHLVKIHGNGAVAGSVEPANELLDCSMGDLTQLVAFVKLNNQNALIPTTNQGRLPWGCNGNSGDLPDFCLLQNESITLSTGIYWFSSWTQFSNSNVTINGYVRILVTGSIHLHDNASVNSEKNPYDLLIFDLPEGEQYNFELSISGNVMFNALIFAPDVRTHFSGQSNFNGNIISQELEATGHAHLLRWIDTTAPGINLISPSEECINLSTSTIRIEISDTDSGIDPESILLYLDNNPLSFQIISSDLSMHLIEIQGSLTGVLDGVHQIYATAQDRAGNASKLTHSLVIDTTSPSIGITYPANGAPLYQEQIIVMGIVTDTFAEECGLFLTVNGNPVEIQLDGQWLTTIYFEQGETTKIIEAIARDGAGNISSDQIAVSYWAPSAPLKLIPISLKVDPAGNGVMETNEEAIVIPSWANVGGIEVKDFAKADNFNGPIDATYQIIDKFSSYDILNHSINNCASENDCYVLKIINQQSPHRDAWFDEKFTASQDVYRWTVHIGNSFDDVRSELNDPAYSPFYREIETMLHYGLTSGCELYKYCPNSELKRGEMAVFIARALAMGDGNVPWSGIDPQYGAYNCNPTNYHSLFADIPSYQCRYIHYLHAARIVNECGNNPLTYCPFNEVARKELAVAIAKAIALGDESIPQTYTDPSTNRYYSCDPAAHCQAVPVNLPFTDVHTEHGLCRYIYYLWSKGITEGCQPTLFCLNSIVSREQAAALIVRAFQLDLYKSSIPDRMFCPASGTLSWGGYDFTSPPALADADIDAAVNLMSNHGLGSGFRIFVNGYFKDKTFGIFPYVLFGDKYDLTSDNPLYWHRIERLIHSTDLVATRKKPVFTIGHVYQCHSEKGESWIGPWCQPYNNNRPLDFVGECPELDDYCDIDTNLLIDLKGDWLEKWDPGSSNALTLCEKAWIKCEYKRLAGKFKARGANVIEIYNEPSVFHNCDLYPNYTISQAMITAHEQLLKVLKDEVGVKVQINIQPCRVNGEPKFDEGFKQVWEHFTQPLPGANYPATDYWALHALLPQHTALIPSWMKESLNSYGKRIFENSTDGQHRCPPIADSVHDFAAEIFQKIITMQFNNNPLFPLFPSLLFEHDTVPFLGVTPIHEIGELKNVCLELNQPDSTVMVDVKAECSDGPLTFSKNDNKPDNAYIYWTSINATSCEISPCNLSPVECTQSTGLMAQYPIEVTTTFTLKCTNKLNPGPDDWVYDYVTIYAEPACGNGCCEPPTEDYQECPEDCPAICDNDGVCEPAQGENSANCPNDCAPICPELESLSATPERVPQPESVSLVATGKNLNKANIYWLCSSPSGQCGAFSNEKVSNDGLHAYADWYGLCGYKCCSFNLAIRVSKTGCSPLIMVTDVEVGKECVKDSDCSPGWECIGCTCECVNPSGC